MKQRTPEWFTDRLGKATASRVSDIIAKTQTGWGVSRAKYRTQLVTERLTGFAMPGFTNASIQWGTETEPHARSAYAQRKGFSVEEVGFIPHPLIAMSGASPDGLIVDQPGLVEIKCPETSTHIDTLLSGKVPGKYMTQMLWQMACTGRQWCDYVSFDPRLPENMQLFICRVDRDSKVIAQLEEMVEEFLNEVDKQVKALNEICQKAA